LKPSFPKAKKFPAIRKRALGPVLAADIALALCSSAQPGNDAQAAAAMPSPSGLRVSDEVEKALRLVRDIDIAHKPSLMYEVADVKTWAKAWVVQTWQCFY